MKNLFSRKAQTPQDAAFWRVYQRESYGLLMWGSAFGSAACAFFWIASGFVDNQPLFQGAMALRAGVAAILGVAALWCWLNRHATPSHRQTNAMLNLFCFFGIQIVQFAAYCAKYTIPEADVIWALGATTTTATVVVFGLMKLPALNTLLLTLSGMLTALAYVLTLKGYTASHMLRFCGHLLFVNIIGYLVRASAEKKERALFIAEEANESKARFLASMSHDLRTPLHGMLQLLSVTARDTRGHVRGRLDMIEAGAKELLTTINRVLDYSAISGGKITTSTSVVDLYELAKKARILHAPLAVAKGVDLRLQTNLVERYVRADAEKLAEVVNNLVANAVKFTAEGWACLEIGSDTASSRGQVAVHIVVRDTGIGIPEPDMRYIGTAFWQGARARSPRGGGTGLGLALVFEIVRKTFSGVIQFASAEGVGTRFDVRFTLPRAEAPSVSSAVALTAAADKDDVAGNQVFVASGDMSIPEQAAKSTGEPPIRDAVHRPAAGGTRVLLVEDNELSAIGATDYLTRAGFDIEVAVDGAEAIRLFQRNTYDIVLMDLQMPVVNGFEATKRIRAIEGSARRRTPILAWTATSGHEVREECLKAGMDGFATKGIGLDLPELILTAIGGSVQSA